MGKSKGGAAAATALAVLWRMRRPSTKVKVTVGVLAALVSLLCLELTVKNRHHFFIASETVHAAGIFVLIYKLIRKKTCSGLSLKSQEITAIFLAARLFCSTTIEGGIHIVLDFTTFIATLWVIYMIRFKLKSTYIEDLDNFHIYYLVVPSAILALLVHPQLGHVYIYISQFVWAFSVYLESVSVLPQLRMMQNAKMIDPFTAHYVLALGIARFLACVHWIIMVYETGGRYIWLMGFGYLWFPMVLLAEIIQTFILADFCYYYIKSVTDGQLVIKMPV